MKLDVTINGNTVRDFRGNLEILSGQVVSVNASEDFDEKDQWSFTRDNLLEVSESGSSVEIKATAVGTSTVRIINSVTDVTKYKFFITVLPGIELNAGAEVVNT
jgi:hypothetical protein